MSVGKKDYFLRFQTLLVFLILSDTAKTKLAILAFLYCGEIEVPSPGHIFIGGGGYSGPTQIQSGGGGILDTTFLKYLSGGTQGILLQNFWKPILLLHRR